MAGQAQNNVHPLPGPPPPQLQLLCRHSCLQAQTPGPGPSPGKGPAERGRGCLHPLRPCVLPKDTSCGSQAMGKQQQRNPGGS